MHNENTDSIFLDMVDFTVDIPDKNVKNMNQWQQKTQKDEDKIHLSSRMGCSVSAVPI